MPKRKVSDVWTFFKVNPGDFTKATCTLCNDSIARGGKTTRSFSTSNLQKHLEAKHAKEYSEYIFTKQNHAATSDCNLNLPTKADQPRQPTLKETFEAIQPLNPDHKRAQRITQLIGEMICVDLQPFSIVHDTGFTRLLKFLEPRYKVLSDKTFRENVLVTMYDKVKKKVFDLISDAPFISCSTDIWSSQSLDSYLGVTVHWIDNTFKRQIACIGVCEFNVSHTGQEIASKLSILFTEWNIQRKVHIIVRDNAANMVCAIREMPYTDLSCTLHTLQLVIKDGLFTQRFVKDAIASAKNIVKHFKHSPLAMSCLHYLQAQLQLTTHTLIQDEPTRWDSTYDMIERLLEQRKAVTAVLAENTSGLLLTGNKWSLLQAISDVLKVFKEVTLTLSSHDSSASMVIPMVNIIKKHLNPTEVEHGVGTMKQELRKSLVHRLGACEQMPHLGVATMLDPRFKGVAFDSSAATSLAENKLIEEVTHLIDLSHSSAPPNNQETAQVQPSTSTCPEEKVNIFSMLDEYLNRTAEGTVINQESLEASSFETAMAEATAVVKQYLNQPLISSKEDPLQFWKGYHNVHLQKLAKKYLGAPPGSVDSERVFSTTGLISQGCRNRLKPDKVEKLLFLNKALPLINYDY